MRPMKFRMYDEKHRAWVRHDNIIMYVEECLVRQGYVFQQFTGLKDKNGVEIYEGDIVQYNANSSYDGVNFEVMWSHDELGWILFSNKHNMELSNVWTPNGDRFTLLQVIGNIFDIAPR